tara:strand:- start:55 stop:156 length:102 start_codon:yes stop_codon:yes gene_type:complete
MPGSDFRNLMAQNKASGIDVFNPDISDQWLAGQ